MADTAGPEEQRSGRGRRVVAVFLSLIQPGAGHVLLGSVRRGMVWAIGMVGVGLIALAVLVVGYVGCAVDTMRLVARRPRWLVVLAGWVALVMVGSGLGGMIRSFYKDRYAQAFTIPSGSHAARRRLHPRGQVDLSYAEPSAWRRRRVPLSRKRAPPLHPPHRRDAG
jgi:TM2 domain-containing membrane protein YozV